MTNDREYTTSEIAAILNRNERTVRMHATRYDLGTLRTPRLRLFSEKDLAVLREIVARGPGEKKKR